MGASNMYFL